MICACENQLENVAIKLIDTFGNKCEPDYINKSGDTALSWVSGSRLLKSVDIKLSNIKCVVCSDELPIRRLLVKCSHACFCEDCALTLILDKCAICNISIDPRWTKSINSNFNHTKIQFIYDKFKARYLFSTFFINIYFLSILLYLL